MNMTTLLPTEDVLKDCVYVYTKNSKPIRTSNVNEIIEKIAFAKHRSYDVRKQWISELESKYTKEHILTWYKYIYEPDYLWEFEEFSTSQIV